MPPSQAGAPIGSLWSEAIRLFRRHSGVFMGLAALQIIPQLVLTILLQATGIAGAATLQLDRLLNELNRRTEAASGNLDSLAGFPWGMPTDAIVKLLAWSLGILFIQAFLFRTVAMGASVAAVGEAYRSGEPRWGQSLTVALAHLPSLFAWGLLSGLGFFGSLVLLLIPCLGIFIWLMLLAFLAMRLLLVPQIIVAEDINVFAAMGRSWELTRNVFWHMFGAWMLFVVVVGLANWIITSTLSAIIGSVAGENAGLTIASTQGVSTILGLLITPIAYIGFTLLYYDRQRQASLPPPPPPAYPPYTPYQ
ncbi:MAG TPA: glycerophosphoryl diester phosphodiesterase membrane domain-containing protein [Herpetosiphonaceae bacterium]|nr:glycerophosphoryl diester phosphodiesterase membrane domain-containing protein [Herpetosiphonaceae bacterium]